MKVELAECSVNGRALTVLLVPPTSYKRHSWPTVLPIPSHYESNVGIRICICQTMIKNESVFLHAQSPETGPNNIIIRWQVAFDSYSFCIIEETRADLSEEI